MLEDELVKRLSAGVLDVAYYKVGPGTAHQSFFFTAVRTTLVPMTM